MKRGKQKWEKLFTWESSQQVKEEQGNLFGFFLVLQQFKLGRKIKKKARNIFCGFSQSFSNTQEESEKNNLNMDDTMKKCGHRQLEWNVWTWMQCRWEIRTPPSLGFCLAW